MTALFLQMIIAFIWAARLGDLIVRAWKAELFSQAAGSVREHFFQGSDEVIDPNVLVIGVLLDNSVHHLRLLTSLAL